ncbi:MAG: hypothetical protein J7647_17095 [Cyanobacteria bacterium SBLK]|nr:hypothetical protein [Cyanobacteria bacterium SBLK]
MLDIFSLRTIDEISASIAETGILTLSDRLALMVAFLNENLEDEDIRTVDRILYRIRRGRIKVAGCISVLQK